MSLKEIHQIISPSVPLWLRSVVHYHSNVHHSNPPKFPRRECGDECSMDDPFYQRIVSLVLWKEHMQDEQLGVVVIDASSLLIVDTEDERWDHSGTIWASTTHWVLTEEMKEEFLQRDKEREQ